MIPLARLALFDGWTVSMPITVALAAVATIGYLVGKRREPVQVRDGGQGGRELRRAKGVAGELETIAETIRMNLASHRACVGRFKERIVELRDHRDESAWKELDAEVEEMLKPTLELAGQISQAYDQIRQQTSHLTTVTETRTDPLTGVRNRRALDETLDSMLAMMYRYEQPFSLLVLDIDHFKKINDERGHTHGDHKLCEVASLLSSAVRDTDVVARYGGEEFVIVMPHTSLDGTTIFAERLRQNVQQQLALTVSGGVTTALDGDTPETLVARADAALYGAKAAGRNRIFMHNGHETLPVECEDIAGATP